MAWRLLLFLLQVALEDADAFGGDEVFVAGLAVIEIEKFAVRVERLLLLPQFIVAVRADVQELMESDSRLATSSSRVSAAV